jgi:hypothetical protein
MREDVIEAVVELARNAEETRDDREAHAFKDDAARYWAGMDSAEKAEARKRYDARYKQVRD